ncbi:MAG: hypothetical protein OXC92_06205 [Flavobacteriaceae bacterium]|nr:hypothetical protein [Flavobacteriaceae bacterium]
MLGNVSEWVLDTHGPPIDNQNKDLNYYRKNTFLKEVIKRDGRVPLILNEHFQIDTLPNERPIIESPTERIQYSEFTDNEIFSRIHIDNPRYDIPRYIQLIFDENGRNNTSKIRSRPISNQEFIKEGHGKIPIGWIQPKKISAIISIDKRWI